MRRDAWAAVAGVVIAALVPGLASAHEQTGQAAGLLSGLMHPVSGLDHVLAMVAVGIWGAQLGAPAMWVLPIAFPMVMAFGGMLALMGIPLPGAELGIALSALILGALVLTESRPSLMAAAAIVAFFAIFHGHAHGTELPAGASGVFYSVGFVAATGMLHACGIALGLVHGRRSGRMFLRAAGGAVAGAGLYFLWGALR